MVHHRYEFIGTKMTDMQFSSLKGMYVHAYIFRTTYVDIHTVCTYIYDK